ncbi:MAG: hypothetical protein LBF04_03315, partial [Prevotellaceae bacterium]|nr:hypothetical protein [Prevotellaceae bacterium]
SINAKYRLKISCFTYIQAKRQQTRNRIFLLCVRHCEEHSDEAIQKGNSRQVWIGWLRRTLRVSLLRSSQ